MRILSLNAWGGALFDALRTWLPSCDADVVCLQEVTRTVGLGGWTRFADGERVLPQRANLFTDLDAVLHEHRGHFLISDAGPVHDVEDHRWHQDFGIATFVHRRLSILGSAATFVHGSYTEHVDWPDVDRPRIAHAVRVGRHDGEPVTVVQLHGLRDRAGKRDTPARRAQAERLAAFVSEVRQDGDLVVVCGDLNVLPDSDTFEVLSRVGLTDLVGRADTRTSRYPKPLRHASYLLVSSPAQVRRFEVVSAPEVSDHRALLLEI